MKDFYHCDILVLVNAAHHGLGRSPKIYELAYLRFNKLKAALAEVCAL